MPAFMKLGNIGGEATDADHKNWIIIESMSSPIFRSIPEGAKDQQRARGDTTLGDISVVRQLDKSSPKLAEACANGTFFPSVEVDFCTTVGNKQEPYLKYKMTNVIVTGYSFHGTASSEPIPTEELTMNFTEVEWTDIVLNPDDGRPTGNVAGKYNPATGRA